MTQRGENLELDPVVLPIPDAARGSVDEWLTSLSHGEPIELAIPAARLVADQRGDQD